MGAYWDDPRRLLDGLYRCAKFGWNRWCSFDNMKLSIFCPFGLKTPIHTPKMDFTPKMGSNVNETPKRHILARVRVVWAIKRENPSSRLTCRWVDEKRYNIFFVIFHLFAQKPPHRRICTKFGAAVGTADISTCTKFLGDRSRGVYSVGGGRKLPSPIDKASRR